MFACITSFQKEKLIAAGFEKNKVTVIPNLMNVPQKYTAHHGSYIAFCGRISKEKGVDLILEVARRHPEISFKFAGEIRDADLVRNLPANCELKGYLSGELLNRFYQEASFFIMASKWYEGFPMSILEAAKYGKCTIGPNHGGFTEIIGQEENAIGKLFEPNNVEDLEKQIVELWNNRALIENLGEKAFKKLKECYDSEVVYRQWEELFEKLKKQ